MKPKANYRAERAERTRKKAQKKEARLAALSRKKDVEITAVHAPDSDETLPKVHRFGD